MAVFIRAVFVLFIFYLEGESEMNYSIADTLWVFLAAILVFFMNLGFACVEAGFARAKNTVNILSKNFIVFAVSSLGFLLLGWGLMFGGDNPFLGTEHLFVLGESDHAFYDGTLTSSVPFWGKFFSSWSSAAPPPPSSPARWPSGSSMSLSSSSPLS